MQVHTFNPNLDGGARGVWSGGDPSRTDDMDYITISTRGNAVDFGNLPFVNAGGNIGMQSSQTRGFVSGGEAPVGDSHNYITKFEFASTGSASDFADLDFTSKNGGSYANATRAIQHRGYGAPSIDHEDVCFFTMAHQGNAVDFGDITTGSSYGGSGMASPTRGVIVIGRDQPGNTNAMEFCTISSTGTFNDFGDTTDANNGPRSGTGGNATRGVIMGGGNPSYTTTCSYITFASKGNSTNFGNLETAQAYGQAVSDSITVIMGGGTAPDGSQTNKMQVINIESGGTAVDCGDLLSSRRERMASSNGHGGLG